MIKRVFAKIATMLLRAVVSASNDAEGIPLYRVATIGGRELDDVEYLQPAGLSFRAPAGAEGVLLSPTGQISGAVLVCASSRVGSPAGEGLTEAEGGLHYAGTYKVFLADDGTLHLGAKDPSDFVALASKVDSEISRINADLSTLKSAVSSGLTAVGVSPAASGPTGAATFDSAAASVPGSPTAVGSAQVKCE